MYSINYNKETKMIGDRIKRKRLAAGMSLQDLADTLKNSGMRLSKAALSNYEMGKTVPSATTLWALAKSFGVSLEYFVREYDTKVVLHGYRKRPGLSDTRHDQILAMIHDEIEKRIEIESILGLEPKPVPLKIQKEIKSFEEAESIAKDMRLEWKLGDQPINSVSVLLEDKGWYVIKSKNDEDFDGLSGVVMTNNRPFAVSREGISIDRMRLNLLHEVGHALMTSNDEKITEKAAFRFASALLFPEDKVYAEVGHKRSGFGMDELVLLKKKYGLSIQAMAYRFRDLGIISASYFNLIYTYINQHGFKIEEPGSRELQFREEPSAYQAEVYRALSEGLISERDVERFLPRNAQRAESSGPGSSADIKRFLALSKKERERVLEAAASAAVGDYKNPDINISENVDEIKEYP